MQLVVTETAEKKAAIAYLRTEKRKKKICKWDCGRWLLLDVLWKLIPHVVCQNVSVVEVLQSLANFLLLARVDDLCVPF
jgi:hypothetical protein